MPAKVPVAVVALALLGAAPVQAATFVSVFDFNWSGSLFAGGPWGITASSEFINPYPNDMPRFDHVGVNVTVEGRVDIVGTVGSTFSRGDVIALNLEVKSNGYRIASYSIAKDDLRVGVMSGSIVEDSLGSRTAELSAFRLMQRSDPSDPAKKFEQIFGCPTITADCGAAVWQTPVPAYLSGNPTPPDGLSAQYGVVVLTDGRADPCCGARSNTLRFYYETVDEALASYRLTWNREKSYTLDDEVPGGLPTPVPLPAGLPMLIGALGMLGVVVRRRASR